MCHNANVMWVLCDRASEPANNYQNSKWRNFRHDNTAVICWLSNVTLCSRESRWRNISEAVWWLSGLQRRYVFVLNICVQPRDRRESLRRRSERVDEQLPKQQLPQWSIPQHCCQLRMWMYPSVGSPVSRSAVAQVCCDTSEPFVLIERCTREVNSSWIWAFNQADAVYGLGKSSYSIEQETRQKLAQFPIRQQCRLLVWWVYLTLGSPLSRYAVARVVAVKLWSLCGGPMAYRADDFLCV